MGEAVLGVLGERRRLEAELADMGVLAAPSHGNFVLLAHPRATELASRLEDAGVIPRPLTPYDMSDHLRVTVGTTPENDRFLQALAQALEEL
jgi:histidinol-phosphate aminotransferase